MDCIWRYNFIWREKAMRRWVFILVVSFGLIYLGCLYTSSTGRGSSGDDDDNAQDCSKNHSPDLLAIHYFVEGTEVFPPVFIDSTAFENLYIGLEYEDKDCNLAGGSYFLKFQDGDWEEVETLPEDIDCSTAKAGLIYKIKPVDTVGELESGNYSGQVRWTDACDAKSNALDFEFTIY